MVAGRRISAAHKALAVIGRVTISMPVGRAAGAATARAVLAHGRVLDVALLLCARH